MIAKLIARAWTIWGCLFLAGCSLDQLPLVDLDERTPQQVVLRTATIDDLPGLKALLNVKSSSNGLPREENLGYWFYENHLRRVEEGNPYHLYVTCTECGKPLGYIHLGVMPTTGYCQPQHLEILNKWVSLGILKVVSDECNPCGGTYERIDNRGLAFIMPILKDDLSREEEESAICASLNLLHCLRAEGKLLPNENTTSYQVISLFTPVNDLINSFEGVGFSVDDNEGFYKFYNKPRVMVNKGLE